MQAPIPEWIFFDLDGTLWDHASASRRAIMEVCTRYGLPPMTFLSAFKQHNDALWAELGRGRLDWNTLRVRRFELVLNQMACGCSSNDAQEMSHYYMEKYLEEPAILPGAMEALALASGVARVGVLTNGARDVQTGKLAYMAHNSVRIDFVQCANEGHGAKPSPDFYRAAQQSIGGSRHLLMVGDSFVEDIAPTVELGWSAVWLSGHQEIPDNLPQDVSVLPNLTAFPSFFAERRPVSSL